VKFIGQTVDNVSLPDHGCYSPPAMWVRERSRWKALWRRLGPGPQDAFLRGPGCFLSQRNVGHAFQNRTDLL